MKSLVVSLLLLPISTLAIASVEEVLMAAAEAETKAFKDGDCDTLMAHMGEDLTFYANGRRMNREMVRNFCENIPRPFGQTPTEDETSAFAISDTAGYTVRDFTWVDKKGRTVHEIVTKIWRKQDEQWVMTHFQSTVKVQD